MKQNPRSLAILSTLSALPSIDGPPRPDPLFALASPLHARQSDPLGVFPTRAAYAAAQAATELAGTLPGTPTDPARALAPDAPERIKL